MTEDTTRPLSEVDVETDNDEDCPVCGGCPEVCGHATESTSAGTGPVIKKREELEP